MKLLIPAVMALSLSAWAYLPALADDIKKLTDDAGNPVRTSPLCRDEPGRSGDPVSAEKPACEDASAAAAAGSAAVANSVLLYASADCSGKPTKISASTPKLAGQSISARSFAVESGQPASVWEKADYSGAKTELVGPSICVSPGWEIASIRLQGQ